MLVNNQEVAWKQVGRYVEEQGSKLVMPSPGTLQAACCRKQRQ